MFNNLKDEIINCKAYFDGKNGRLANLIYRYWIIVFLLAAFGIPTFLTYSINIFVKNIENTIQTEMNNPINWVVKFKSITYFHNEIENILTREGIEKKIFNYENAMIVIDNIQYNVRTLSAKEPIIRKILKADDNENIIKKIKDELTSGYSIMLSDKVTNVKHDTKNRIINRMPIKLKYLNMDIFMPVSFINIKSVDENHIYLGEKTYQILRAFLKYENNDNNVQKEIVEIDTINKKEKIELIETFQKYEFVVLKNDFNEDDISVKIMLKYNPNLKEKHYSVKKVTEIISEKKSLNYFSNGSTKFPKIRKIGKETINLNYEFKESDEAVVYFSFLNSIYKNKEKSLNSAKKIIYEIQSLRKGDRKVLVDMNQFNRMENLYRLGSNTAKYLSVLSWVLILAKSIIIVLIGMLTVNRLKMYGIKLSNGMGYFKSVILPSIIIIFIGNIFFVLTSFIFVHYIMNYDITLSIFMSYNFWILIADALFLILSIIVKHKIVGSFSLFDLVNQN